MNPLARFFRTLFLSLLTLAVLDVTVGYVIAPSYQLQGNRLERYFGYGFSIENKLKQTVGTGDADAHPLAMAGWNPTLPERYAAQDPSCERRYTFYGMSFSHRVARALAEQDPCASVRMIGGPAAPLSHSYYEYQRFHDQDDAEVVVLGVLASSLTKNLSTSHCNSAFEAPGVHMYPRHRVVDGELTATMPPAATLQEFRELLHTDVGQLKAFMAANDKFYSPWIFGYPQLDRFVVVRMLRRAYGQSFQRKLVSRYRTAEGGFTNRDQLVDVSLAMLVSAAETARADSVEFVVLLLNDQGFAKSLDRTFGHELTARGIRYLSSSSVVDARDVSNFLPDGHFQPELDRELAGALKRLVAW